HIGYNSLREFYVSPHISCLVPKCKRKYVQTFLFARCRRFQEDLEQLCNDFSLGKLLCCQGGIVYDIEPRKRLQHPDLSFRLRCDGHKGFLFAFRHIQGQSIDVLSYQKGGEIAEPRSLITRSGIRLRNRECGDNSKEFVLKLLTRSLAKLLGQLTTSVHAVEKSFPFSIV